MAYPTCSVILLHTQTCLRRSNKWIDVLIANRLMNHHEVRAWLNFQGKKQLTTSDFQAVLGCSKRSLSFGVCGNDIWFSYIFMVYSSMFLIHSTDAGILPWDLLGRFMIGFTTLACCIMVEGNLPQKTCFEWCQRCTMVTLTLERGMRYYICSHSLLAFLVARYTIWIYQHQLQKIPRKLPRIAKSLGALRPSEAFRCAFSRQRTWDAIIS